MVNVAAKCARYRAVVAKVRNEARDAGGETVRCLAGIFLGRTVLLASGVVLGAGMFGVQGYISLGYVLSPHCGRSSPTVQSSVHPQRVGTGIGAPSAEALPFGVIL